MKDESGILRRLGIIYRRVIASSYNYVAVAQAGICDLTVAECERTAGVGEEAWYGSNSTVYMRLRGSEEDY
jgi:hypothetical protein